MLHFLEHEFNQPLFGIEYGLGHLEQGCFIGRAAAFCHEQEVVFIALDRCNFHLSGHIIFGIHFVIHGERRILGIPQIGLCIGFKCPFGQFTLILGPGPDLLALFAHNDGGTGVLTHGIDFFSRDDSIFQKLQGDITVIVRTFRVINHGPHLLQMFGPVQMGHIPKCGIGQQSQCNGLYHDHILALKFPDPDMILGQQAVLCGILFQRKHGFIVKFHSFFPLCSFSLF